VDHETEVGRDHPILRLDVAALDALGKLDFLCGSQQRVLGGLLEEQLQLLEVAGLLVPLVLCLRGRLVQALDVAPLRSAAAADAAPEAMLLVSVLVRFASPRFRRQTSLRQSPVTMVRGLHCRRLTYYWLDPRTG